MVTFAALVDVVPDEWTRVAVAFRTLADAVADHADALGVALDLLTAGWSGDAASNAHATLAAQRGALYAAFPGLVGVDQAVSEFADIIAHAQAAAEYAARPKPGSIVQVGPDGSAALVPLDGPPDQEDIRDLEATEAAIADALYAADNADRRLAHDLDSAFFSSDLSAPPPVIPEQGTDPSVVVTWWLALSPEQQRYLVLTDPARVADLDGVPADARDQASRLLLHQDLTGAMNQQVALLAGSFDPATWPRLDAVKAEVAGLDAIEKRLDETGEQRAYLLDLDARHGDVIVSINNPDLADNTLTFVPGVGTSLASAPSLLEVVDNIQTATGDTPPTGFYVPDTAGSVATIGWLGYPAPANLPQAASIAPAETGAPALKRFADGLRDTHEAPGGHETVLGYSYGSVVTGHAAARFGGLDADDVILVGSPGVVVDRASDMGPPPGHVWASDTPNDVIKYARNVSQLSRLTNPDWEYFGVSPVAPEFGAQPFTSARGANAFSAHESYFNPGTPSLLNIARIAMGDYEDVS